VLFVTSNTSDSTYFDIKDDPAKVGLFKTDLRSRQIHENVHFNSSDYIYTNNVNGETIYRQ
jgi:hypothetical protein